MIEADYMGRPSAEEAWTAAYGAAYGAYADDIAAKVLRKLNELQGTPDYNDYSPSDLWKLARQPFLGWEDDARSEARAFADDIAREWQAQH